MKALKIILASFLSILLAIVFHYNLSFLEIFDYEKSKNQLIASVQFVFYFIWGFSTAISPVIWVLIVVQLWLRIFEKEILQSIKSKL